MNARNIAEHVAREMTAYIEERDQRIAQLEYRLERAEELIEHLDSTLHKCCHCACYDWDSGGCITCKRTDFHACYECRKQGLEDSVITVSCPRCFAASCEPCTRTKPCGSCGHDWT